MVSNFAKNTLNIINEKGFKICAVAKIAGYNPRTFYNMLNGKKIIKDNDIENISKALGVSPNELFNYQNNEAS